MVELGAEPFPVELDPAFSDGRGDGAKRYVDEAGAEVLVTKGRPAGNVWPSGPEPRLSLKEAKPLPASGLVSRGDPAVRWRADEFPWPWTRNSSCS